MNTAAKQLHPQVAPLRKRRRPPLRVWNQEQRERLGIDEVHIDDWPLYLCGVPVVATWRTRLDLGLLSAAWKALQSNVLSEPHLDLFSVNLPEVGVELLHQEFNDQVARLALLKGWRGADGSQPTCRSSTRFDGVGGHARFHVDTGFGNPGVLFATCFVSDAGHFVMPNLGFSIPARRGVCVIFDPLEPHGVVKTSGEGPEPCLAISKEFYLNLEVCRAMGKVLEPGETWLAGNNDDIVDCETGLFPPMGSPFRRTVTSATETC